ncbi:hypothetical protein BBJ28_00002377 [Nothophytophthora sp. Chile5]|nr:hypothetical protein BBJ28_00002377 [Nothophytophthora sp. Chile5]
MESGQLHEENKRLREALHVLQQRYDRLDAAAAKQIQDLTDENELLAESNRLLLEQQEARSSPAVEAEDSLLLLLQVPDELLIPGPAVEMHELVEMDNVHSFGNLLCVSAHALRPELVITGGADRQICVHDWRSKRTLCAVECDAPVLTLAFNPRPEYADYFVAASMDAKHGLYRLVEGQEGWMIENLFEFHDHTRQGAFRVAWSASGRLFATGASDKALHIYQCSSLKTTGDETCEKIQSFYFNGTVEAIAFAPASLSDSEATEEELKPTLPTKELIVIAVRDDCYVHYVDCSTFEKERYDLLVERSATKRNVALRNFYGHKAGAYSQPRVAWHPSEKYVISNTEDSGVAFLWSIASERAVEILDAHETLVRDLACTSTSLITDPSALVTVSYDKRLKVWGWPLAKTGVELK